MNFLNKIWSFLNKSFGWHLIPVIDLKEIAEQLSIAGHSSNDK